MRENIFKEWLSGVLTHVENNFILYDFLWMSTKKFWNQYFYNLRFDSDYPVLVSSIYIYTSNDKKHLQNYGYMWCGNTYQELFLSQFVKKCQFSNIISDSEMNVRALNIYIAFTIFQKRVWKFPDYTYSHLGFRIAFQIWNSVLYKQ